LCGHLLPKETHLHVNVQPVAIAELQKTGFSPPKD
jgi:hypothetical protein